MKKLRSFKHDRLSFLLNTI